jgi:hypothetical protein
MSNRRLAANLDPLPPKGVPYGITPLSEGNSVSPLAPRAFRSGEITFPSEGNEYSHGISNHKKFNRTPMIGSVEYSTPILQNILHFLFISPPDCCNAISAEALLNGLLAPIPFDDQLWHNV